MKIWVVFNKHVQNVLITVLATQVQGWVKVTYLTWNIQIRPDWFLAKGIWVRRQTIRRRRIILKINLSTEMLVLSSRDKFSDNGRAKIRRPLSLNDSLELLFILFIIYFYYIIIFIIFHLFRESNRQRQLMSEKTPKVKHNDFLK
jgi:hypothetical protein